MSEYRRWYVPGGTFFFTLVTFKRRPILCEDVARGCLREAMDAVRADWPFELVAVALLPEHLHTIWSLPPGDTRYLLRLKRIKEEFTRRYLRRGGSDLARTITRSHKGERGVWQRRFWEHTILEEDDLKRCLDYVHWNPKKHGHVTNVRDWPWSTFHRYAAQGEYPLDWGSENPTSSCDLPEWGE